MSPSYQFFPCQTPSTLWFLCETFPRPPPYTLPYKLRSLSRVPFRLLYPPLPRCWVYVEEVSVLDAGLGSALGLWVLVKKSL